MSADEVIGEVLATLVTLLGVAIALYVVLGWLRRSRPELSIGVPVGAAFGLRIGAAVVISLLGVEELRGTDEPLFLRDAEEVTAAPFLSGPWIELLAGDLHAFFFAFQLGALDSPDLALRITQIGIAVAGIALLAAAVYELAGPRAAIVAAWLLAVEPTNVFYSEVLHKEANMILAVGLVSLGGAALWRRGEVRYLLPIALGCLIAATTRPYAGAFLTVAAAAVSLHAWIRNRPPGERFAALACTGVLVAIVVAVVWELSDKGSLRSLQERQEAGIDVDANLPLEPVDYSSRQAVVMDLPRRISDVLVRPYPWQLGSTKQQVGLIGSMIALAALIWLLVELVRNRRRIVERAGPLLYVGFFLLLAYSLSALNAGTAFRYRTQLVAIGLCLVVSLIQDRLRQRRLHLARRAPELALAQGSRRS